MDELGFSEQIPSYRKQVNRSAAQVDEVLDAWRNRPPGPGIYLYLDALYEKMRVDGQIRDAAKFANPPVVTPPPAPGGSSFVKSKSFVHP